ncbi:serine/threonine protein kinase [Dictyobacter aurantiacus]|uniref:non-specific serine/threonine protein kinase n=1 Tax=Dictyobacter aurantiacus TaxID=1936993 RepID=A0A401ZNQ3_9CHLR|nr:serine/threonine-protein kinase [Dictyobacter aurantiacus]GCE08386.1 hypothetical protein KDAU_57150 [Dictyobacter aurantiacus]
MNKEPSCFGKYELLEPIGTGGMAQVWKALHPELRRFVAVKILHADLRYVTPGSMTRFVNEGQAIAQLHHPNIVQVFDLHIPGPEEEGCDPYLVMEFVDGPTLDKYIQRTSRVSLFPTPEEIVELFASISQALDYAHRKNIVHRDIKPSNILLDSTNTEINSMGEPILSDFGLVKIIGAQGPTEMGALMGTPLYIAPEQVQGGEITPKSDLYSLGVILYEICTGTPPFRGDNAYAVMRQHMQDEPTPPTLINPRLPAEIDVVIKHAMAKDPAERFNSATSMTIAVANSFHVPIPERLRVKSSHSQPSLPPELFLPPIEDNASSLPTIISVGTAEAQTAIASHANTTQAASLSAVQAQDAASPQVATEPVPPAKAPVEPVPPPKAPAPSTGSNRVWRSLWPIAIAVLILLVIGATLLNRVLTLFPSGAASSTNPIVGQMSFYNTGNALDSNNPTINDGVMINLKNVAMPAAGKVYKAWLYNKRQPENDALLLGNITITNGAGTLNYRSPNHQNLLASMSAFVITENAPNDQPVTPVLDTKTWRYSGSIPDQPRNGDPEHFSQLDHLRHLLSSEPTLENRGLHNGIDFWFQHDVEQIQQEAASVKNLQDPVLIRQKLTDMLYYMDGPCAATETQATGHLPAAPDKNVLNESKIGLLECKQLANIHGHLQHIRLHLAGIVASPGASASQISSANAIDAHMVAFTGLITRMHDQVLQLGKLTKAQLQAAQNQRNQLDQLADSSVSKTNWTDADNKTHPGVATLCNQIAGLASIDIRRVSSSPSP